MLLRRRDNARSNSDAIVSGLGGGAASLERALCARCAGAGRACNRDGESNFVGDGVADRIAANNDALPFAANPGGGPGGIGGACRCFEVPLSLILRPPPRLSAAAAAALATAVPGPEARR